MWAFQYKHGDRPLEGYTIQRAAGRGGFGEVYYAVSDSGREVALKVVQGYEAIELRGISQCMNLKSPHLVSIFDVKHNAEGKPFVIMEFVSGLNLRQLIDESPGGLGTQKSAFFLREIAKGLSFLHDCGIVHRDLKPANIFYENGYVKIGDYGLSKAITTSQHSGQTVTVGTVHYMAPEIGAGKYDRSIDIYAMGAVLYELLTGMPPYVGATPTEVLMKHLSAEPDVSNIPQPFARVIQKAMAKDPARRYGTVQEMVEDVFGAEHVRQSVSVFAPEDLSMIAERVAKRAPVGAGVGGGGAGEAERGSSSPGVQSDPWARVGSWMDDVGGRVKQMWNEPGARNAPAGPEMPLVVQDPLAERHRWMLAILVSVLAPLAGMLVRPQALGQAIWVAFFFVFTAMWGATLGMTFAHRTILSRLGGDSGFVQKLIVGQMASVFAILLSMPFWIGEDYSRIGATLLALLAPLFVFNQQDQMVPDREERVAFGHLFGAGFVTFILAMIFRGHTQLAVASAVGVSLLVQILSPWDPQAATRARQRKESGKREFDSAGFTGSPTAEAPGQRRQPAPVQGVAPAVAAPAPPGEGRRAFLRFPVPRFAPVVWLMAFGIFVTAGVTFCVAGASTRSPEEGPFIAIGVSALLLGVLCFLKSFQRRMYGWWGYLARPLLIWLCVATALGSAIVLGNQPGSVTIEETIIATIFIVFPSVMLLVLLFLPSKFALIPSPTPSATPRPPSFAGVSPSRRSWATILCLVFFFTSAGGLHRLYVGRIKSGILWLCTFGLLGIGQIVDLVLILTGKFTDIHGRAVLRWDFDAPPPATYEPGAAPTPSPQRPMHAPGSIQAAAENIKAAAFSIVDECGRELNDAVASITGRDADARGAAAAPVGRSPAASAFRSVGSYVPRPEQVFSGLLSALVGLLIFVGTIVAIALAVDVPGMLYAGVPTLEARTELERGIFEGVGPEWPALVRTAATVAVGIILMVALTILALVRRQHGIVHMFRGVLGVVGLVVATIPLSSAFQRAGGWVVVGEAVADKRHAAAAQLVLDKLQTPEALIAAVVFIVSILILAWPARRAYRPVPQFVPPGE